MLEYKIGDVEYQFNCKLGATLNIKNKFNKPFKDVVSNLATFDIPDLIKLLHATIINEVTYKEFETAVYDNLGMMELYDLIQLLIKKIQYPNLTEEEIDKKLDEKNAMTENALKENK